MDHVQVSVSRSLLIKYGIDANEYACGVHLFPVSFFILFNFGAKVYSFLHILVFLRLINEMVFFLFWLIFLPQNTNFR